MGQAHHPPTQWSHAVREGIISYKSAILSSNHSVTSVLRCPLVTVMTSCDTSKNTIRTRHVRVFVFWRVYFADMCGLSVCVLVLSLSCCLFTKGRGLTFTSARVLFRTPIDGPARNPSMCKTAPCVWSVLSCPVGRSTTACVSWPKRLGGLHRLAHAAGCLAFLWRLRIWALSLCVSTTDN